MAAAAAAATRVPHTTSGVMRSPLPPPARWRASLLLLLHPLSCVDLSREWSPDLYATDASLTGQGVTTVPVGSETTRGLGDLAAARGDFVLLTQSGQRLETEGDTDDWAGDEWVPLGHTRRSYMGRPSEHDLRGLAWHVIVSATWLFGGGHINYYELQVVHTQFLNNGHNLFNFRIHKNGHDFHLATNTSNDRFRRSKRNAPPTILIEIETNRTATSGNRA